MERIDSIENSIARIKDALRKNSLSAEQISALNIELSILNQNLEKRNKIISEERRQKSENQQKPHEHYLRNRCVD